MPIVIIVVLAFYLATYIVLPISDPDLWWHIVVGRWIISHQALPYVDYWNAFGAGQHWQAYSYLPEILFALFDRYFGAHGLLGLTLALSFGLSATLFYCLIKVSNSLFFGSLLAALATVATFDHFALRPQTFTWIYYAWMLYLSFAVLRQGLNRRSEVGLFLVTLLWANTHLTIILAIVGVLFIIWDGNLDRSKVAQVGLVLLVASILTPYFGGEWLTFLHQIDHPFKYDFISEFRPVTIFDYSAAFLAILLILLFYFMHLKPDSIGVGQKLLLAVMTVGSLAVYKFLPYSTILVAFVLADFWRREAAGLASNNLVQSIFRLSELLSKIPERGIAFLIFCLAFVNVYKVWGYPIALSELPVWPVQYIRQMKLKPPIMNSFNDGGYLMYEFSDISGNIDPFWRVSVDGRTNVTPDEIFKLHLDSLLGSANWREYIERTKAETILWRLQSPLTSLLHEDSAWCEVYRIGNPSKGHVIFVKRQFFQEHKTIMQSPDCTD